MANPDASSSPTPGLSANAFNFLSLLLNVIDSEDWATFNDIALKNPKAFQALSKIISSTGQFNGMSFLHAVVRHHPPLEIVSGVVKLCPDTLYARDCLNRTPLHVAAGIGAHVSVIKLLAMSCPEACKVQDEDGRTPLHFACDVDCRLFEGEPLRRDPPSFEVVHALLSASIMPASMEDDDEMSPLEYAILSDANVRVVKLLQKAAQKYMKAKHNGDQDAKPRRTMGAVA